MSSDAEVLEQYYEAIELLDEAILRTDATWRQFEEMVRTAHAQLAQALTAHGSGPANQGAALALNVLLLVGGAAFPPGGAISAALYQVLGRTAFVLQLATAGQNGRIALHKAALGKTLTALQAKSWTRAVEDLAVANRFLLPLSRRIGGGAEKALLASVTSVPSPAGAGDLHPAAAQRYDLIRWAELNRLSEQRVLRQWRSWLERSKEAKQLDDEFLPNAIASFESVAVDQSLDLDRDAEVDLIRFIEGTMWSVTHDFTPTISSYTVVKVLAHPPELEPIGLSKNLWDYLTANMNPVGSSSSYDQVGKVSRNFGGRQWKNVGPRVNLSIDLVNRRAAVEQGMRAYFRELVRGSTGQSP